MTSTAQADHPRTPIAGPRTFELDADRAWVPGQISDLDTLLGAIAAACCQQVGAPTKVKRIVFDDRHFHRDAADAEARPDSEFNGIPLRRATAFYTDGTIYAHEWIAD